METIVAAIVVILLISAGIIAFSYFYSTSSMILFRIKEQLILSQLYKIESGIPTSLSIPYLRCNTTNVVVELLVQIRTSTGILNITKFFVINNTIIQAYWPSLTCTASPITSYINMSYTCIKISFLKILLSEIQRCNSSYSKSCILTFYIIRNKVGNYYELTGYIRSDIKDYLINMTSNDSVLISRLIISIYGYGKYIIYCDNGEHKVIILRAIFLESSR